MLAKACGVAAAAARGVTRQHAALHKRSNSCTIAHRGQTSGGENITAPLLTMMMRPPGAHTRASSETNCRLSAREKSRVAGASLGSDMCAALSTPLSQAMPRPYSLASRSSVGHSPVWKEQLPLPCPVLTDSQKQPATHRACAPRSPCSTPSQTRHRQRADSAHLRDGVQNGTNSADRASSRSCGWWHM